MAPEICPSYSVDEEAKKRHPHLGVQGRLWAFFWSPGSRIFTILCLSLPIATHHWHLPATKRVISSMLSYLPCKTQPSSLVMATSMESVAYCSALSIYIWKHLERTSFSYGPWHWRSSLLCTPGAWLQTEAVHTHLCSPKVTTEWKNRRAELEHSVEQSLFLSVMKRNTHIYYKIFKCFGNE